MQFRIVELLTIVGFIGFSIAGLQNATPQMESCFFSFTLLTILFAYLVAFAQVDLRRCFWGSFAITATVYLGLAHIPDHEGRSPRESGPEITTELLRLGYKWSHGDSEFNTVFSPVSGGIFCVQDKMPRSQIDNVDPFSQLPEAESNSNLALIIGGGQRVVPDISAFMRIGHCVWALLIGWISGHFVKYVRASAVKSKITSTGSTG